MVGVALLGNAGLLPATGAHFGGTGVGGLHSAAGTLAASVVCCSSHSGQ